MGRNLRAASPRARASPPQLEKESGKEAGLVRGAAPAPVGPVVHLLVNDVTERGLRGAGGSSATGASASHLQTGTIMRNLWTRSCDARI